MPLPTGAILMGYLALASVIMVVAVLGALERRADIRWIISVWLTGLAILLLLLIAASRH